MTRAAYIGVDNLARNVNSIYVGVDGIAREVLKGYVGDESNIARQFWPPYGSGGPGPYNPPDDPFKPNDPPDCETECPGGSACLQLVFFPSRWDALSNSYGGGGGGSTIIVYRHDISHLVVCRCGMVGQFNFNQLRILDRVIETYQSRWEISESGEQTAIDSGHYFHSYGPSTVQDYDSFARWQNMWLEAIRNGQKCTDPIPVLPYDPPSYSEPLQQQSAFVSNTDFANVLLDPDTLTEEDESVVLQNAQLNNPVEDIELEEI